MQIHPVLQNESKLLLFDLAVGAPKILSGEKSKTMCIL